MDDAYKKGPRSCPWKLCVVNSGTVGRGRGIRVAKTVLTAAVPRPCGTLCLLANKLTRGSSKYVVKARVCSSRC